MNIRQLIRESVEEAFNENDFLNREIQKINSINSFKELDEQINYMTLGHHFPLNPPDPLRTILRNKIEEIYDAETDEMLKERIFKYKSFLEGEAKDISPPPGAMY